MFRFRLNAKLLAAICVCALSNVCVAAPDAATQEARRLYNDARSAMEKKQYRQAAANFEAASRLKPHAVALYTAAQAWELAGAPARAADAYAQALETPTLSEQQARRSRERLVELTKRLAVLVVRGLKTTSVQLDDHSEVNAPARLHGVPGDHVLTIVHADGTSERRSVTLKRGANELDAEAPEVPKAAAPKEKPAKNLESVALAEPKTVPVRVEREPFNPWLPVGFATAGAGIATLAGAAVLGLSANDAEATYNNAPSRDTYDHAKGLEGQTNLMLAVGSLLTASGAGILVWQALDDKEKSQDAAWRVGVSGEQLWVEGAF